jgi:hypothetical protein
MPLGSSRADACRARARDPSPMEVVAVADLGNGWVSCSMRSGRYTYRKVVVHTTNPATTGRLGLLRAPTVWPPKMSTKPSSIEC